jgi:SAM-dependent methyltransferase
MKFGMNNVDVKTVNGFSDEWSRFDQSELADEESTALFAKYFKIFPWHSLPAGAVGFDAGCGTGRWGRHVAPRIGALHCVDASSEVISIARKNLRDHPNCAFHVASVANMPLADGSADFGYSLGVLHHLPDTAEGIRSCVSKLKPGAPFLLYLYYAFDNRAAWFRAVWKLSDLLRRGISRCPNPLRYGISQVIAAGVYLPLARVSRVMEAAGFDVSAIPLSFYRNQSFYTMRTDALDRFGTRLERRFTASEIAKMMRAAGLDRITFSDSAPFWCAVGFRAS